MTLEHLLYLQQEYPGVVFDFINDYIVDIIHDDTIQIAPSCAFSGMFLVACYFGERRDCLNFSAFTTCVELKLAEEILQHIKDTQLLFV